jgi:hypothetical protein
MRISRPHFRNEIETRPFADPVVDERDIENALVKFQLGPLIRACPHDPVFFTLDALEEILCQIEIVPIVLDQENVNVFRRFRLTHRPYSTLSAYRSADRLQAGNSTISIQ